MEPAVPRDIHEPHERSKISLADPSETVLLDLPPPIAGTYGFAERVGVQTV